MSIIQNKKAYHDYFVEDKYEAGIVLEGWEVKAIRDNISFGMPYHAFRQCFNPYQPR